MELKKYVRQSNLELFRIIVMLSIIAHHYVVNSGLLLPLIPHQFSGKSIFYFIFGAWGKTGINCFVFITGYFMCKSEFKLKKVISILTEFYFYKVVIFYIFCFFSIEELNIKNVVRLAFPFTELGSNFNFCFIIYLLFIPFINILINGLDRKKHLLLIILCLSVYTIIGSLPNFTVFYNYVTWFCILHVIISYIRFYEDEFYIKKSVWIYVFMLSLVLAIGSIIFLAYYGSIKNGFYAYQFVADCHKVFAVTVSLSMFMLFKNLKLEFNPAINFIASSTYGIFLIHTNSNAMRKWLWVDTLKNAEMCDSKYYILHAFISVIGVFICCLVLDKLRIILFHLSSKIFLYFHKMSSEE